MTAADPSVGRMTDEQVAASASTEKTLFIEAEPGSGKTTVAATRYRALRFGVLYPSRGRAVVATSFTRSATHELRQRVRIDWGPSTLAWPHRVTTIDSLIYELFEFLLQAELVRWPKDHKTLRIEDSWRAVAAFQWTPVIVTVRLEGTTVRVVAGRAQRADLRSSPAVFVRSVNRGICTHEEVRKVLAEALEDPRVSQAITERLGRTVEALVVDEVLSLTDPVVIVSFAG